MSTLSPQRKRMVVVAALAGLGMIAVAGGGLATSWRGFTTRKDARSSSLAHLDRAGWAPGQAREAGRR